MSDTDYRSRNMHGIDDRTPLWRVFKADYLIGLLRDRANVLTKPECWDDPFETLMGQCMLTLKPSGPRLSLRGLYSAYYGQCWTNAARETDATWRIYAPAKERGVRVRVSAGRLFDTIFDATDHFRSLKAFLGPISYMDQAAIHDLVLKVGAGATLDGAGLGQARMLLIKRREFDHEAEVRLLYSTIDSKNAIERLRSFPVDPNSLLEELVLDPRLSPSDAKALETTCRSLGYVGPIHHSQLYAPPPFPELAIDY